MPRHLRIALTVALCFAVTLPPTLGATALPNPDVTPVSAETETPLPEPALETAAPDAAPPSEPELQPESPAPAPSPSPSDTPSATPSAAPAPLTPEAETVAPLATRATGPTSTVKQLLDALKVSVPSTTRYDRALFEEGVIAPGTQCRTRAEVLRAESRVPVTTGASTCSIVRGDWLSWYDGSTQTDPTTLEMDHLVALKEAWISGADRWTAEQRRAYANDITDPATLTMVLSASNQTKSAHDPSAWLPTAAAQCDYVRDWVIVKTRWKLTIDSAEKAAIIRVLDSKCSGATARVPQAGISADSPAAPVAGGVLTRFPSGVHRVAGADRYETAVKLTRSFSPGVSVVYVAVGLNFPDALSAGPAAAAQGGALLLVRQDRIPEVVAAELQRLKPRRIVVAGSEGVISGTVYKQLAKYAPEIRRDAGADRYETSRVIIERAFTSSSTVFVATGANFPDALSAAGAAGAVSAPVMLVKGDASQLDAATARLIGKLGATSAQIAGSPAVVSAGIEKSLRTQLGTGNVVRYAGSDRYETSVAINKAAFGKNTPVFLATGTSFADALAGGTIAAQSGHALYISRQECVPIPVSAQLTASQPSGRVLLGSTAALSANVEALRACAAPKPPVVAPPVVTPPPVVKPQPPAGPGPSSKVNCTDFATQRAAQSWFDFYRNAGYGDIAGLDRDKDGIACETLP